MSDSTLFWSAWKCFYSSSRFILFLSYMLRSRLGNLLPASNTSCSRLDRNLLVSARACRIPTPSLYAIRWLHFLLLLFENTHLLRLSTCRCFTAHILSCLSWPDIICADYHHLALYPILLFPTCILDWGTDVGFAWECFERLSLVGFVSLIILEIIIFLSPHVYRELIEDAWVENWYQHRIVCFWNIYTCSETFSAYSIISLPSCFISLFGGEYPSSQVVFSVENSNQG
jgi:hypothetical protein